MSTQAPTARASACDSCGKAVTLILQLATSAETAWRWFDCPYCLKVNFLRLPGHILYVHMADQVS